MPDELEEVFTDAPKEEVTVEPVESKETTEPAETVPEDAPKAEEAPPPNDNVEPASTEDKQIAAHKTAAIDERRKRQAAMAENQALKAELENLRSPRPDALEEPEEAMAHLAKDFQQQLSTMGTDMSRQVMMAVKDDYLVYEAKFMDLAEENPALVSQMLAAPNQAKFAYDTAKKHEEWEAIKDIDTYKAKVRADVIAEVKSGMTAENKAKMEKEAKASNVDLPSLANAGSAGSQVVTDESLEALFDQ